MTAPYQPSARETSARGTAPFDVHEFNELHNCDRDTHARMLRFCVEQGVWPAPWEDAWSMIIRHADGCGFSQFVDPDPLKCIDLAMRAVEA